MTVDDKQQRFLALFEPQRDALWRFVRSMVRSKHEAEDIMSETVLQAYQGFENVRDGQAFTSYLFTIASRLHKRQRWRRSLFGEYDEEAVALKHHTDPLPDAQYDVLVLRKALQKLPTKQRESVVLFDILGLSLEEVRDVQGGTLSGVKSRLHRGRQTLAQKLDAIPTLATKVAAPYTNGVGSASAVGSTNGSASMNGTAQQTNNTTQTVQSCNVQIVP